MCKNILKTVLLIAFMAVLSNPAQSQLDNLNSTEKLLVKKWQVYRTLYEMEMNNVAPEEAFLFTFSADFKWKKELMNPKLVYHGSWSVDTAKQIVYITWEEKFDINTYQYKIKTLTDKELIIEPLNANTETVYYHAKE